MPVIIDGTLGVNAAAITTTNWTPTNITTGGNTTLGDASGDTVTINAGNTTFTSTGARILGDFSNATLSNRVSFQSNVTNGFTYIHALPNGTGSNAGFTAFGGSDPTNASFADISNNGVEGRLRSSATGTATTLPLALYVGTTRAMQINTAANVMIGGTTAYAKLTLNSSTSSIVSLYGGGSNSAGVLANAGVGAIHNSIVLGQYIDASNYGHGFLSYGYYGDDGRDFSIGTSSGSDTANSTYLPTITFKPSGNVGIGTTSPGSKLTVSSAGAGAHNIQTWASSIVNPNNTGSEIVGSQITVGGNIIISERQPNTAYSDRTDLVIVTDTGYGFGKSEKLRLTAGGVVSIGNPTPDNQSGSAKLFVQGPTNGLVSTDVTSHVFATFAGAQYGTTQNNWGGGILLKPIVSRGASVFLGALNDSTNMEGSPSFVVRSGNYATNTVERLRVTSDGKLGIGVSNPTHPLSVNGPARMANSGFMFTSVDKDASSGSITFYYGEIGGSDIVDNVSALLLFHLYRSDDVIPGKSAVWVGLRACHRGSAGVIAQISSALSNVSSFSVAVSGDSTLVTCDGGPGMRIRMTVLAGGGVGVPAI